MKFESCNTGVWLSGEGRETDIVISTRLRLARNIESFHFKGKLAEEDESRLESLLSPKVLDTDIDKSMQYIKLDDTPT